MNVLHRTLLLSSCCAVICIGLLLYLIIHPDVTATEASSDRPVIGYIELPAESDWRSTLNDSVKQAAARHDVQLLTISASKTQDSEKEALRALISYDVDAIVFSPVIAKGWDSVLKEARDAEIPIILSDSLLDTDVEGAISAYVGTPYLEQGKAAAEYLIAKYGEEAQGVRIVEFSGAGGSGVSAGLSGGVRRGLAAHPAFQIVYTASAKDMLSKSRELFSSFLASSHGQPAADVFLGFNDAMTCGAIEAMETAGIRPGEDICVVSFGGEARTFQLLQEGKIDCLVSIPPDTGEQLISAALDAIESGEALGNRFVEWHVFTAQAAAAE